MIESISLENIQEPYRRAVQRRFCYPTLAVVLLSLAALIVPIAADPEFVDNPFDPSTTGNIYLPPSGEGDLSLVCSTREPASFTWIAVGGTVYGPGLTPLNITQVNDRTSVLYVRNDGFHARGILLSIRQFQCRAKDTADMTENSTRTFTFAPGAYPAFSIQPGNVQVNEGEDTELSCAVNEALQPAPSVLWMFQNSTGNFTLNPTRFNQVLKQTTYYLKIDGYLHEDGTYWCTATNEFGVRSSQLSRVIVTYFETDFNFIISPSTVKEGDQVTFSVQIVSSPPASSISIRKVNERNVLASTMNSNKLVSKMTANCNLTCVYNATAIHQSTNYTQTARLTVLCKPANVALSVTNVSHDSLNYTWNVGFDGHTDITNITITCISDAIRNNECERNASKTTMIFSGVTSGGDTLGALCPNVTYHCRVFAENVIGRTGSDVINVTTLATVPDKPNVKCAHTEGTLIKVEWTDGFNGGSAVSGYEVMYLDFDLVSNILRLCNETNIIQGGGSCQLTHLTRNHKYNITVRATNTIGTSLPGEITCKATCTLDPIQNKPVKSYDSGEKVSLKFLRPSSKCGDITDYQVQLCGATSSLESNFNQKFGLLLRD